ncbi:MAG: ethanolamine utilization protein EutH [Oscillospiraceae bacterium]|nr:ethanolamine utilization protein EutH [Oscillospiraceae bacterium]
MTFKLVLNTVISVFFVLGALDYIIGDRLKLGSEFVNAFSFVGRIALSIVGMICLSPVIARLLTPVVTPVYEWLHLDPGMFISLLLPPDSGGYSIAMDMCRSTALGAWSGTVVAAHIGGSFSFTIPTMLGVIEPKYHRIFSLGALSGLVACPVGCILGGLLCGLPFLLVLVSMIPAMLVSALIALGLMKKPDVAIRAFQVFSRLLRVVIIVGLAAAGVQRLTGYVVIPGMKDLSEGVLTAGTIGVSMAGILCLTKVLSVVLRRPLAALSRALKINDIAILGCFNSLCAAMPGGAVYGKMDPRGRVVFGSMAITSANVLGAHLSYVGANCPEMLMPTVVSKLASGVLGVVLALLFADRILGKMPEPDAAPAEE